MATTSSVTIPIAQFRTDPASSCWDLPAWGHPFGQGIMPLFMNVGERLFPVGTAFTIGRGVTFIVTAEHNVREALKQESDHTRPISDYVGLKSLTLHNVGLSVLYHRVVGPERVEFMLWPLETIDAGPPTDVVFAFPVLQTEHPTLVNRLSFDLPRNGEPVWSIGSTDFKLPSDGIPLEAVKNGTFNWQTQYSHRLVVVEGCVDRIFTQRFAKGFLEGACFSFDAEIFHGQSGGPVISMDGVVRGISSAGASNFYGRPASLASLLFPFLFSKLRFGAQIGPMRMNANHPLINLIEQGIITTDGSETRVGFTHDPESQTLVANPTTTVEMSSYIHDDFNSFQSGKTASKVEGGVYRIKQ